MKSLMDNFLNGTEKPSEPLNENDGNFKFDKSAIQQLYSDLEIEHITVVNEDLTPITLFKAIPEIT